MGVCQPIFVACSLLVACTPEKETTTAETTTAGTVDATGEPMSTAPTSTAPTSTTGETGDASATTGPLTCVPPAGEALEVLLLADAALVVRPGSLDCGAPGGLSCDCIAETIDRLTIALPGPVAPGTYPFADGNQDVSRIECFKGDDGCSDTAVAGTVTIVEARADCVTGTLDFGAAGSGSFAVVPCGA